MTSAALHLAILPAVLLLGCQSPAPWAARPRYGAEFPPPHLAGARSPSLWPQDSAGERRASHIADSIARDRGDIVTVIVREAQAASSHASKSTEQETSLEAQIDALSGVPLAKAFPHGLFGGAVSSNRTFDADGSYDKGGILTARISAVVVDVLPNGNLVVSGAREVRVDDETKVLSISGIVRIADLTPSNTVLSESLAEARIVFEGDGPMTRNTERGLLGTIVDWIWHHLWPF